VIAKTTEKTREILRFAQNDDQRQKQKLGHGVPCPYEKKPKSGSQITHF